LEIARVDDRAARRDILICHFPNLKEEAKCVFDLSQAEMKKVDCTSLDNVDEINLQIAAAKAVAHAQFPETTSTQVEINPARILSQIASDQLGMEFLRRSQRGLPCDKGVCAADIVTSC
jgi:hypothetical protein